MTTENEALLDELETKTENWDLAKIRGLLNALSPGQLYFSEEQFHRWKVQVDRLQSLYRERIGTSLGS